MGLPSSNSVLWISTLVAVVCAAVAYFRLRWALPVLFIWIASADFLKRILFLGASYPPTEVEYFWMLALPDLILAAAILRVGVDSLKKRSLPWRPGTLDYLVGAFFLWSTLEVFNPTFSLTVRLAGFKSSGMYVAVYFLVRAVASDDPHWVRRLLPVMVAAGVIATAYGIFQAEVGFQEFELDWLDSGLTALGGPGGEGLGLTINWFGIVRPFSIFASHEQLGWFLGFVVMIMLASRIKRPITWSLVTLILFGVSRTISRSSWVFLGSSILLAGSGALVARSKSLARDAGICLAIFLATIGFWTISGSGESYSQRASALGSYEWRIYSFQELINDPAWHKPLGNGIGSMWVAWRLGAPGTANPDERILSHVGLVDIVYELGIVGAIAFHSITLYLAWRVLSLLRQKLEGPRIEMLIAASAIVLGVVAANSTVTTILMFRPIAVPFWMALGVAGSLLPQTLPHAGPQDQMSSIPSSR